MQFGHTLTCVAGSFGLEFFDNLFHLLPVVLAGAIVLVPECRNLFHLLPAVLAGASASAGVT